ncbi:NAD-dependent dehydratase [candidate division WOR-3 bacterium RBG_13_43_14]|uniref:UDP-glucuronate decarboxylase n=1 Tax=candidate division WOR-3 bacterium RBG_13_43_14 TaxID=1802590 RepID=A0A1F4U2M7_UNCW3|nr:MAG: NAD-dependent dehydratase [candidate division WOR-3 bacterium RBG_13_43_14]
MKIVITGGAGFIGSHLVDHYLESDYEIVVIDNLLTGSEKNLEHNLSNKNFEFIIADVCNVTQISSAFDILMHFACPASPFDFLEYPLETMKVMSVGTYNMLEIARNHQAKFILASTSEVYGDPLIHPQTEDYTGNVNMLSPRAVYDESKRFAETLVMTFNRKYKLKTGIVRIFNTYGERMRGHDGRVVPTLISEAIKAQPLPIFGDGTQTRSFCYISDMIEGIDRAMRIDYSLPINLGNPEEHTVLELAQLIKKLCKSNSPMKFMPLPDSDPKQRKPDISKAKELLDWSPQVQLEQGLIQIIKWFREKKE